MGGQLGWETKSVMEGKKKKKKTNTQHPTPPKNKKTKTPKTNKKGSLNI